MLVPEITYTVSGGTLNLSHLLTHYVSIDRITRRVRLSVRLSPLASSDKNKKNKKSIIWINVLHCLEQRCMDV